MLLFYFVRILSNHLTCLTSFSPFAIWLLAYVIPYGMLPDVIEEDEIATGGLRREGIFMGMFTFFLKLGVTIALMCTNFALQLSGYSAETDTCIDKETALAGGGITNRTMTLAQTDATRWVLKSLVGPVPAFFFVVAIIASVVCVVVCCVCPARLPCAPAIPRAVCRPARRACLSRTL